MTDTPARKVLDEVWTVQQYSDGSGPAVYCEEWYGVGCSIGPVSVVGSSRANTGNVLARARIAACAPEALKLLLELERACHDHSGEFWDVCAICHDGDGKHAPDCRLVALLVKAGLR